MLTVNTEFIESLDHAADGSHADSFNASACLNCGTCTALCPIEIDLMPRLLFRYVLLGAKDKVLENASSIYSCLQCKMCEDNCPAGVHITENIRILRTYINANVYGLSRS